MSKKLILTLLFSFFAGTIYAQTWNYRAASPVAAERQNGYIELKTDGSNSTLQFVAGGNMDMCYRGELKANVERTPETILITIPPRMGGFTEIRFNIKSDGTGGIREVKEGSEWKPDEYRRDLTL